MGVVGEDGGGVRREGEAGFTVTGRMERYRRFELWRCFTIDVQHRTYGRQNYDTSDLPYFREFFAA